MVGRNAERLVGVIGADTKPARRPFPTPTSRSIPRYTLSLNECRFIVGANRDGEAVWPGAVSGKRRAAATVSNASRRYRREHRGGSERAAKADPVSAGPVSFVPPFRGLLLCTHCGHRQPNSSERPTGRSALGRGIQTSSGSGSE